MSEQYLTIDIGGTFTKYAIMNENCEISERGKVPTQQLSQEQFLEMLTELCREKGKGTAGIAISSAGIIDSDRGFMYTAGSIRCVQDLELVKELESRTGLPVSLENDARSAALAEIWKGSLAGCKNAAAVILGTGVGGAVIVDGKVLHGRHLLAGEFSYLLTNADDPLNQTKMLGSVCGVPALIRLTAEKTGISEKELSGELIFERANAGDAVYLECLRDYARGLAVLLLNIQFLIDPEKIAIGGGVSAQPLLLQLIREEMESVHHVYPNDLPVPEITACKFFNDSNLIGALYTLLKKEGK